MGFLFSGTHCIYPAKLLIQIGASPDVAGDNQGRTVDNLRLDIYKNSHDLIVTYFLLPAEVYILFEKVPV